MAQRRALGSAVLGSAAADVIDGLGEHLHAVSAHREFRVWAMTMG
jgi:hypothetical protein